VHDAFIQLINCSGGFEVMVSNKVRSSGFMAARMAY